MARADIDDQRLLPHHQLPPGFRFAPTDETLISHYLRRRTKLAACCNGGHDPSSSSSSNSQFLEEADGLIVDFDIYSCNPWELPRHLFHHSISVQPEMYFFSPTHPPANGHRRNVGSSKRCGRRAGCGVWHENGKLNPIKIMDRASGRPIVIGHTSSFKFEMILNENSGSGCGSSRRLKTDWLMHQYKLTSSGLDDHNDLVLCKIYEKPHGKAARTREQYDEDDDDLERLQLQRLKRGRVSEPFAAADEASSESTKLATVLMGDASSGSLAETHSLLLLPADEPQQVPVVVDQANNNANLTEEQQLLKRPQAEEPGHLQEQSFMTFADNCGRRRGFDATGSSCDLHPSSSFDAESALREHHCIDCGDLTDVALPLPAAELQAVPSSSGAPIIEANPVPDSSDAPGDWISALQDFPLDSIPPIDDLIMEFTDPMLPYDYWDDYVEDFSSSLQQCACCLNQF